MYPLFCSCSLLFLIFDLSLASLQLSSSPDTNGSYCPGKVTFTCLGISVPIGVSWRINGSIIHAYTYTFAMNEMFPKVIFMSDNVIITVKSAAFIPPSTHNVTIELSSNVSDLLQSTVSCRTATQESDSFSILLTVPQIPNNIMVYSVYNFFTKTLSEIKVFWNTSYELCMDYSYQVMLTNGSSTLKSENVNCRRDTQCQVSFIIMSQMFKRYIIEVVTLDFQELVVNASILPPINYISSFLPNISVEFSTCFIKCYSDSNVSGTCKIDFPEGSVSGTVNSEYIQVLETLQPGTVHFNATFNIDGRTYTFRNSSDLQYNKRWTTGILICAILTPVLWFLSVILVVLFGVCLHKRKADFKMYLGYHGTIMIALLLLSVVSLMVSLSCWIAGLVEVINSDNCTSLDKPQSILIAACSFSVLTFILDVAAILFVLIYHPKKKEGSTQSSRLTERLEPWQNKEEVKKWQTDKNGMLLDEHGKRVVENTIVVSGHRGIGETDEEARCRVAEEHTREGMKLIEEVKKENVNNNETDSNAYSQKEHVDLSSCQKGKLRSSSECPNMGRKPTVFPGDRHYAFLRHDYSTLGQQQPSLPDSSSDFMPHSAPSRCGYLEYLSELEYGKLNDQKGTEKTSTAANRSKNTEERLRSHLEEI